jgi:dipeptidase E
VIYVSGGNQFFLLQQAQKSGFVEVIRNLIIEKGRMYIGTSAGSIVAGPDTYPTYNIDDVRLAPDLKGYEGFGLVNFCIFPHWGSAFFKDLYLNNRLDFAYKDTQLPIVILTDKQYVRVKDGTFEIVEVK